MNLFGKLRPGGNLPLALQLSVQRARLCNFSFMPFRFIVVVTHLLGADAADIEVLVQTHVLNHVEVADRVSAATRCPARSGLGASPTTADTRRADRPAQPA